MVLFSFFELFFTFAFAFALTFAFTDSISSLFIFLPIL